MRTGLFLLFTTFFCTCVPAQDFSFLTAEQNTFVKREVRRLTLKQKAGQMTQVAVDLIFEGQTYVLTVPAVRSEERLNKVVGELEIGSIINVPSNNIPTPAEYREIISAIQAKAMETTGIPVIYGQDAIHGANYVRGATLFAQPLGVAASFNTDLAEELAAITAYELKAASIPWNFSPAMDVNRQPNWPRTWESFGEDQYANQQFGLAMLRGYQGSTPGANDKVLACLKHFTGYGIPVSGRDRTPANIPERQLRELFLPQYQSAIDSGALTIMINSGEVNGVPVHSSKELLTDILRDEMGFEGLLVSDWQDVRYLYERHHVATDLKEAVKMSIDAGMDMSMTAVTTDFPGMVVELVQEGQLTEGRIDTSVARILAVKVAMGLYEKNVWDPEEFPEFGGERHARKALQSAEEAIVLLKNDGLPLPIKEGQRILVVGPTADNMRSLNGGWTYSWQGQEADKYLGEYNTIREAIQKQFPGRVTYAEGVSFDTLVDIGRAVSLARASDVIVICLGELSYTEDVGNINSLELPAVQRALFDALDTLGKEIVLVMAAGRPRLMTELANRSAAVLYAPYPGPRAGDALAGILAGNVNPSARLPLTYPRHSNALVYYDHKYTEGMNGNFNPLFEFGYGLSYTDFTYSDLVLSSRVMRPADTLTVSVRITNQGDREGKHSVLLYSSDLVASITPSVKRLRKFTKIHLEPGESDVVTFQLLPRDLSFIGRDNSAITEAGTFKLTVGDLSTELDFEE